MEEMETEEKDKKRKGGGEEDKEGKRGGEEE